MNTEQERADLLPCPFCGSTNIEIQISTPDREGVPTNLMCSDCGASGPWEYEQGNSHAKADDAWNRRADLQSQKYTSAIGEAGQAYLDQFKNAHALPAEFRWSELWAVMCVAANKVRPDALQSQDREDAGMVEILREAAEIIAAIPPEHAPDNIRWPIVDELEGFASKIEHARSVEGGKS